MNKDELRDLLKQPYRLENWKMVVDEVFPNVSYLQNPLDIDISHKTDKVESFKQLGTVRLNDGKNLAMFEVHVAPNVNISRNRVELRNLVAPFIDQERSHGVLVIYEQGLDDYRFTFTAKETEFDEEKGDFYQKETDTKRFTYILGPNEPCRTPGERFWELSQKKSEATLNDVEKAFSVERLSKEFFTKYKQHYEAFVGYLNSSNFKASVFNGDEKAIRDFVKIMLGRIVFLHFVHKKGWLGASTTAYDDGDKNFMQNFWNKSGKNEIFYTNHLSELFEALNTNNRPGDAFKLTDDETVCIPYLGGGLFEEENGKKQWITFPEGLFEELFNFFGEYNFTIDENDPEENEVGIDPEMLGHIFENLLEDNKDKGAFYTPKAIVKYMCQESLIQYLITYFESEGLLNDETIKEDIIARIGKFVRKYEGEAIIDYDKAISEALFKVKVCDPAIGSGAFPMGILNEMMMMINTLHHASPDVVEELWHMKNWEAATVKKHIIQNSIYGVDNERGAVDIARLRFWLSLIMDELKPCTLPSLDYKIVVGDSLLSRFKGEVINIDWDVKEGTQSHLFGNEAEEEKQKIIKSIAQKQREFFEIENNERHELTKIIRNLKIDLLIKQLEIQVSTKGIDEFPVGSDRVAKAKLELYNKTNEWKKLISDLKFIKKNTDNAFQHFDWRLDFPEIFNELINPNLGFDIIIGNPPYVEHKKLKHIAYLLKDKYKVYTGSSDLSVYFFELGFNVLKDNGVFCFINTNKFFNTGYGRTLRDFLLKHEIISMVNFEQVEVFEKILVSSVILLARKKPSTKNMLFKYLGFYREKNWKVKFEKAQLNLFEEFNQNLFTDREWVFKKGIELDIRNKIEKNGTMLKHQNSVEIKRGVTTGFDQAFIISDDLAKLLNDDIIKPLLKGAEIKKYQYSFENRYLIFTRRGINIKDHPSVKEYLEKFKIELTPRLGPGKIGRKPGDYKWYEIQDNTAYYPLFDKIKLIWPLTADKWGFALDESGHYLTSGGFFLVSRGLSIKYILAILNSRLMEFYFGFIGVMTAGGAFTLKKATIEEFPIISIPNVKEFENMVDAIIDAKTRSLDTKRLEKELDIMIYKLYDLDFDEVRIIDPELDINEKEYNN
ncbi:MAG: Eco57I restriction-modification methylase domain-containing protein [Bacteroidales bacterium]|nr:Eco57I restriction-modification methylase domain-containing protein [Bacteroidales bacterium]